MAHTISNHFPLNEKRMDHCMQISWPQAKLTSQKPHLCGIPTTTRALFCAETSLVITLGQSKIILDWMEWLGMANEHRKKQQIPWQTHPPTKVKEKWLCFHSTVTIRIYILKTTIIVFDFLHAKSIHVDFHYVINQFSLPLSFNAINSSNFRKIPLFHQFQCIDKWSKKRNHCIFLLFQAFLYRTKIGANWFL